MPLYEYRCEKCGEQFEVRQKFADEPLTTHEVCGGPVERLISAPAFQFKGSGWYVTDYGKSGKSGPNGDSGKANNDAGKSGSSDKSETKKDSSGKDSSTPAATKDNSSASSSSSSSDKK